MEVSVPEWSQGQSRGPYGQKVTRLLSNWIFLICFYVNRRRENERKSQGPLKKHLSTQCKKPSRGKLYKFNTLTLTKYVLGESKHDRAVSCFLTSN